MKPYRENGIAVVIFDWAGTLVDHGCQAPVGVFLRVLAERGVQASAAQAREPMGTHKREHLRRMLAMAPLAAQWRAAQGAPPTEADLDALYARATDLQVAVLPDHAEPIPGAPELLVALAAAGIRVGSTTGYNAEMLEVLRTHARRHGVDPEVAVPASAVARGRPAPDLCWTAAMALGAPAAWRCVNVGDTPVDVEAGRNAGFWSVGLSLSGNLSGLDARQLGALPLADRVALRARNRAVLLDAGAHAVIDSVADLLPVLEGLAERVARGERP